MTEELSFEIDVLEGLEQDAYVVLNGLGIPSEDQQYYLGYTKRLWTRALAFTEYDPGTTYDLEKTSLRTEYVLRGWDPNVLDALEDTAQRWADVKRTGVFPSLEVDYSGMELLGGNEDMAQWGSALAMLGSSTGYVTFYGMESLGGPGGRIQFQGVLIVVGTVT